MNLSMSSYGAFAAFVLFTVFMGTWWFYGMRATKH